MASTPPPRTPRPNSVRALGARRLTQATAVMVVAGVTGTGALIGYEASQAHASTSSSTTSGTTTDSTSDATSTGSSSTGSATDSTSSGSSQLTHNYTAPQATSGGS